MRTENMLSLILKKNDKDTFLMKENLNQENLTSKIRLMLSDICMEKDAAKLEIILCVLISFEEIQHELVDYLNQIILMDWHKQHENLAMILQNIKSPTSVESLYCTVYKRYSYLAYDESYALAVKCIWALGAIKDEYAIEKLEQIVVSADNSIIKENAIKQLELIKSTEHSQQ